MITREVCFAGVYEPHISAMLRLLLGPPATFVDVGANWGYFTLLSSKLVGSEGRVISIEPDPRVFPVLEQNVALNNLTNVECFQQAASDGPGTVEVVRLVLLPPQQAQVSAHAHQHNQHILRTLGLEPFNEILVDVALTDLCLMDLFEAIIHGSPDRTPWPDARQ